VSDTEYLLHRILLGIPEGAGDIANNFVPLEMNADLMNGGVKHKLTLVDFRKGCYLVLGSF
jgi:folate-binding protein YgfZ